MITRPTLMAAGAVAAVSAGLIMLPLADGRIDGHSIPLAQALPLMALTIVALIVATMLRLGDGPLTPLTAGVLVGFQATMMATGVLVVGVSPFTGLYTMCTVLVVLPTRWAWPCFLTMRTVQFVATTSVEPITHAALWFGYCVVVGIAVFGTIWVAELALTLGRTRAQLAELAVARERLRASRDLHDTLGQELTATGLRAELAARLVTADPNRAVETLHAIQRSTEQTLTTVREINQGRWQPCFSTELDNSVATLKEAGMTCELRIEEVPDTRGDRVMGWALREAVTNVLKHSAARTCRIATERRHDVFRLSVTNDGARPAGSRPGSGLVGLTDRVASLGGRVDVRRPGRARFQLLVELPVEPA